MSLALPRLGAWGQAQVHRAWQRMRRPLAALMVLVLLYGLWPYVALWQLHLAVMQDNRAALAELVDLGAVKGEIARRLNKDRDSLIGELSDPFIAWLESGIRQHGPDALESLVTLDWVRDQLIAAATPGLELLSALSYAFFDSLTGFRVRTERGDGTPLILHLELDRGGWRVTAVYY